jgi:predicted ATPase/DNA-binding winged helix-turn-helix (wHTH) protein
MSETRGGHFGPFHLDLGAEQLWQGSEVVHLTAKAFAVLRHLVAHAGQLVTKEDLFAAVWASAYVSEAALAVCIGELRRVLSDSAQMPQYVETVRGRGYRFVAPITAVAAVPSSAVAAGFQSVVVPQLGLLVGREAELATLLQHWAQAHQGHRQVVLVTGEAGIGKTTLVDAFVAQVAPQDTVWLGRGQCIEQHGAGEAYLPLLEALGRLGRGPDGDRLITLLRQQAPSWLVHLPSLVPEPEYEGLQRRVGGTTRERMLRELAEAIEVLTAERPLVLVLEDLHWCDVSTLDWLAYVAHRREAARLLVLGTYRPVEAIVRAHPVHAVTHDLRLHGQATEVSLGPVSAMGVATYLARRFGAAALPAALAGVLHQRTEGNPLFLVALVDDWIRQGVLCQTPTGWRLEVALERVVRGVPESLRQLLDRQLAHLTPAEQTMVEAASVAGAEFSAAALAAALAETVETVEAQCAVLVRRGQLLEARGCEEWSDGTVAARYGFLHALYQELLYEHVPVNRRVRWHRQIGARLEAGYGARARELAAELAVHFTRGHDSWCAVRYLHYAGENAMQRQAQQEALGHLTQGMELLHTCPPTPERTRQELAMQMLLGPALLAIRGYAAPEVGRVYTRARELCQQVGDALQLFRVVYGLALGHYLRAELQVALELGEQLLSLAQQQHNTALLLESHFALGRTLYNLGEGHAAHRHFTQVLTLYDPTQHHTHTVLYGQDPALFCLAYDVATLWLLGYPDQALHRSQETLHLHHGGSHTYSRCFALLYAARLHQLRREWRLTHEQAEAAIALATEHSFAQWVAMGTMLRGWALAEQGHAEESMAHIQQGLAAWRATGARASTSYYLALLSEAYGQGRQPEAGVAVLTEACAFVAATAERFWEAEIYRLKGTLLLQHTMPDKPQAEVCFQRALAIARRQQAKSLELRAAMSLARLWQQQGRCTAARDLLAPIYGWFTEGFDTADLQEAKSLLEALAG